MSRVCQSYSLNLENSYIYAHFVVIGLPLNFTYILFILILKVYAINFIEMYVLKQTFIYKPSTKNYESMLTTK